MIRSTWAPPPLPDDEAPEDTAGTLGGTRLYEQPAHAAQRDAALGQTLPQPVDATAGPHRKRAHSTISLQSGTIPNI